MGHKESNQTKTSAAIVHWFNDVMEINTCKSLFDEKFSYLAIPQENVLLCNNLCPVCTHIQVAFKKVISTFAHELAIFNNKRVNTFEKSSSYGLDFMSLHRKSAKHVKMNRYTCFISQNFFKGLQQIGETEMLSRVNFGRKCTLFHVKLSIAIFFKFYFWIKKCWFFIFIQNAINLKHHVKSETDLIFQSVLLLMSPKVNMFYLCVYFFSFIDLN